MNSWIILTNMNMEDEQGSYLEYIHNQNPSVVITRIEVTRNGPISLFEFIDNVYSMKDLEAQIQLKRYLIRHQWEVRGQEEEYIFFSVLFFHFFSLFDLKSYW